MAESWASSEQARRAMRANRSRDTQLELAVRRMLHAQGLRYRVDFRPIGNIRRKADIVFTRYRIAVFLDGCFWHGCECHFVMPKANAAYWEGKITRNQDRDAETNRLLEVAGWTVLRYWEHQSPEEIAAAITTAVTVERRSRALRQPL